MTVPSHFIHPALHFLRHFIPKGKIVTSYQALHTSALHTMRHFISKSLHTSALHTKVTSYRCTSYQGHFIPVTSYRLSLHTNALHTKVTSYQGHFISVHFIPKSLHTEVISYQSQISHFVPMHCIPVQFILVISCRSLYTSPLIHVHFI